MWNLLCTGMIMTLDLTSCVAISSMCDSLTSLRAQGALCIEKVQRTCRRCVRCPRLQVVTPCCSTVAAGAGWSERWLLIRRQWCPMDLWGIQEIATLRLRLTGRIPTTWSSTWVLERFGAVEMGDRCSQAETRREGIASAEWKRQVCWLLQMKCL